MSETTNTTAPQTETPKPKPSNARKIPFELHDEVWRLSQERKTPEQIAEALEAFGVHCQEWPVRRTLKFLKRQHEAEEQAVSLREQALREGHVAAMMRAHQRDEQDEVIRLMAIAARKNQPERVEALAKVERALRASVASYTRDFEKALSSLTKAEQLAARSQRLEQLRDALRGVGSPPQSRRESPAEHQDRRQPGAPTATPRPDGADPKTDRDPPRGGGSGPSRAAANPPASPGRQAAPPAPPDAKPPPASGDENFTDRIDPDAPLAVFTSPADGAELKSKPDSLVGKCNPHGQVMVTVDDVCEKVTADKYGIWRLRGKQMPHLKPGQHHASVSSITPARRLGRAAWATFTILTLLFILLPMTLLAAERSLTVNKPISSLCGFLWPPFAVLRDPQAGGDAAPNRLPNLRRDHSLLASAKSRETPS